MFNKYWRNYPWFLQLYLFILLMFIVGSLVAMGGTSLVYNMTDVTNADVVNLTADSSRETRKIFLLTQLLSQIGIFLIPPILFAYVTHPRPKQFLGIRKPGKPIQWLLVVCLILGALPIEMSIAALIQKIGLSESVLAEQKKYEGMMKGIMNMNSTGDVLFTLLVMAVMPALGEELLFRGVMMRFAAKRFKSMLWPIVIVSVIFALAHTGNITGMFSIFFAGVVLALIYYLTGSLVASMLAHFVNNGVQVLLAYIGRQNGEVGSMVHDNEVPWMFAVTGLIVFSGALYMLWQNRTPLPADWTKDFTQEEIEQMDDRKRRRLSL